MSKSISLLPTQLGAYTCKHLQYLGKSASFQSYLGHRWDKVEAVDMLNWLLKAGSRGRYLNVGRKLPVLPKYTSFINFKLSES